MTRGESVYFRVPAAVTPGSRYFCCADTIECVSEEEYDLANKVCPPKNTHQPCKNNLCRELNREVLPIDLDDISVSAPDASGRHRLTEEGGGVHRRRGPELDENAHGFPFPAAGGRPAR